MWFLFWYRLVSLDGSEPSANHGVQYTIPIALQGNAGETVYITVKAIAVSTLLQDSEVVTYEYELKLPATSGGGSSGGSSSGGSLKPGNSGSTVTTNPDGSKTETTTKHKWLHLAYQTSIQAFDFWYKHLRQAVPLVQQSYQ